MMRKGQKKDICPLGYWNPTVDHPELMVNATEEPRKTVADLIRTEMFHYAKSNMALVNIYIKVSKTNWKMWFDAIYILGILQTPSFQATFMQKAFWENFLLSGISMFNPLDSQNTKKLKKNKTKMLSFYKQQSYFIVSKKAKITI